jgi:hypothetical protein
MRTGAPFTPLFLACVVTLVLAAACASGSRRLLLADGSYELKCEGALSTCLMQMEKTCADNGYDVVRATEKRERVGPIDLGTEIVRSDAVVRCRKATTIFSVEAAPPPPVPAATDAPPPLPHAPLPALSAAPAPSATPPASAVPAPAAPAPAPPASVAPSSPAPAAP